MKLAKSKLKQIIQEELQQLLNEGTVGDCLWRNYACPQTHTRPCIKTKDKANEMANRPDTVKNLYTSCFR